jgi:ribosomal protein L37E
MSQIQKVRYDKNTTVMDQKEEKYWMHFLSKDPLIGGFIKSQMQANPMYYRDLLNQPVCERCEKFAFHHKDGVMCPSCGHWSTGKTNKVKIHMAEGHFR